MTPRHCWRWRDDSQSPSHDQTLNQPCTAPARIIIEFAALSCKAWCQLLEHSGMLVDLEGIVTRKLGILRL